MSNADVAEILKLPAEERMRLVELSCESLAEDASALPLSNAHHALRHARLAEHERGPNDIATNESLSPPPEGCLNWNHAPAAD